MLSWVQGEPDPPVEGGTGSLCLLDWKTEYGPFLCARSQAEVSWMIKRSLTKLKYKKTTSVVKAGLRSPQS